MLLLLKDVAALLKPGMFAVVADVAEDGTDLVDDRMKTLGGIAFRTQKETFDYELQERQIADMQAQIDQLKAAQVTAAADRKAQIQTQIDNLSRKLEKAKADSEQWAYQMKCEAEVRMEALQKKAARAQGEAKATINTQINQLRAQYESSAAKLRNVTADKLKDAAARIQKAG